MKRLKVTKGHTAMKGHSTMKGHGRPSLFENTYMISLIHSNNNNQTNRIVTIIECMLIDSFIN